MIYIDKPHIELKDDLTYVVSHVKDESQQIDQDIFYSVPDEYGQFLTDDVADAFVVGVLLPAALYNEDIYVDAPLSEKLYYNITNSVLFTLSFIYGNKIKLNVKEPIRPDYHGEAVGCGCSLGVDSFAAIMQHLSPDCPESYRITHLTYFNVGAMGYVDLEKAEQSYKKDLQLVKGFASKVNLPVVCLSSNISLLYKDFDFDASGEYRNFSAVLSLQKLFRRYLYGSGYTIKESRFSKSQSGYYEYLLAPWLSTENLEIVIANPDMTRVDKTRYIADNPLVQESLYVCWKELIANKWPNSRIAKIKDEHLNCSRCDKCKRTMLALDLLGSLPLYHEVFDIPHWNKIKDSYIARVIAQKNTNTFYAELSTLMDQVGYVPNRRVRKELFMLRHPFLKKVYETIKQVMR